jgi:CO/xanthine dehydrogenase FAD-binding subunit
VKPLPFIYHASQTLSEALDLLAESPEQSKILAGGQSLVPLLNFHLVRPETVIDINPIRELTQWTVEAESLVVKALTRHAEIERLTAKNWSPLAQVAKLVGHPAIRSRGTVVGSLAHADPAGEWPVALSCWPDCSVRAVSKRGSRHLAVRELFRDYLTTALDPDEVIVELRVPKLPAQCRFGFAEFSRRHGDFALAAAACVLELQADGSCGSLRLVIGGVSRVPLPVDEVAGLMRGRKVEEDALERVRQAVADVVNPAADIHSSSDFRRGLAMEMARVAIRRAAIA